MGRIAFCWQPAAQKVEGKEQVPEHSVDNTANVRDNHSIQNKPSNREYQFGLHEPDPTHPQAVLADAIRK
jgi:hypothetical protein